MIAHTGSAFTSQRSKKLIAAGQDMVNNARLAANLEEITQRPFDGLTVGIEGRDERGELVDLRFPFQTERWVRSWFRAAVEQINSVDLHRLTDNFILIWTRPADVDWFDDRGWRSIVKHWKIAAWIAQRVGFKGIAFDPEPYDNRGYWSYWGQPGHDHYTYDEYYDLVRRRGREVMAAIVEEYPDVTILCYRMNSANAMAVRQANPHYALYALEPKHGYGLLSAFFDGWLDVIPPTVKLVDGCEDAYYYNSAQQYLEARTLIRKNCQTLVSAENRAKYRSQVQVGYGLLLDAYVPRAEHYVTGLNVERLAANVTTALRVAGEYVWIYGEQFRWWPTPNISEDIETWPEILHGCEQVLQYARDPVGYAERVISEAKTSGEFENLARNADFSSDEAVFPEGAISTYSAGGPPAGWGTWQHETSAGAFRWDREMGARACGSARMEKVTYGAFSQQFHPVQLGQRYAIRAVRRIEGNGLAYIRVGWKTDEGLWTQESFDRLIFCLDPDEEWAELFDVVEVPDGVSQLVIALFITDQRLATDIVWYDDVELFLLP